MSKAKKTIVRRFYEEVMGQGNVNLLDEIMAPDFADHGETLFGSPQGRDTLKQGITISRAVLGDLHVQLHGVIAAGDLVGVRGTMRCIQQGEFLDVAASGNELTWNGLALFRVVDGRITERWFNRIVWASCNNWVLFPHYSLLIVLVHAANIYDGRAVRKVLTAPFSAVDNVKKIWADKAYVGEELAQWVKDQFDGVFEVVAKPKSVGSIQVLPQR